MFCVVDRLVLEMFYLMQSPVPMWAAPTKKPDFAVRQAETLSLGGMMGR